jgi:hypothetical protein
MASHHADPLQLVQPLRDTSGSDQRGMRQLADRKVVGRTRVPQQCQKSSVPRSVPSSAGRGGILAESRLCSSCRSRWAYSRASCGSSPGSGGSGAPRRRRDPRVALGEQELRRQDAEIQGHRPAQRPRYRHALFYLVACETSCYRYWGQGIRTDYGAELARRACGAPGRGRVERMFEGNPAPVPDGGHPGPRSGPPPGGTRSTSCRITGCARPATMPSRLSNLVSTR